MNAIPAFLLMTQEARKAAWARYDAAKEKPMKVGDKEQQVRALKEARATKPALEATPHAPQQETPMKPKKPKAKTTKRNLSEAAANLKAAKAKPAKSTSGERARYDWNGAAEKAAKGTIPPLPDFSAPTHDRFRKLIDEVAAAAKAPLQTGTSDEAAKKAKASILKKIEISPTSSTPKAVARYRDLCVEALKAA